MRCSRKGQERESVGPALTRMPTERPNQSSFFLPDFCAGRMALAIVLIVELVALVISLVQQAPHENFWVDLAAASMFLLWLGLGCAAALCRARPWLTRLTTPQASALALFLIGLIVALVSEVTFQLGQLLSAGAPSTLPMFPSQHAFFLLRNLAVGL